MQPEDVRFVNLILPHFPEVGEYIQAMKLLLANARFPINSFNELAEAMGGENTILTFRGRPTMVAEVRKYIPAYYFPIGNESDLIAKIADLRQRSGTTPSEQTMQWTQPTALPQGVPEPPSLSEEEILQHIMDPNSGGIWIQPR